MLAYGVYRFGNRTVYGQHNPAVRRLRRVLHGVLDILVVRILASAQLPAKVRIGRNLGLPHGANGVVLSQDVVIGDDCTIYHQVTIGVVNGDKRSPVLGDRVFVGAGAKILGPVTIGDDAMIGANAVVLQNVPAGATAVGAPARIIRRSSGRSPDLASAELSEPA